MDDRGDEYATSSSKVAGLTSRQEMNTGHWETTAVLLRTVGLILLPSWVMMGSASLEVAAHQTIMSTQTATQYIICR